jgi:hypothetical protein
MEHEQTQQFSGIHPSSGWGDMVLHYHFIIIFFQEASEFWQTLFSDFWNTKVELVVCFCFLSRFKMIHQINQT